MKKPADLRKEPETPVRQPCCDAWAKAHEWGTDNEEWGNLVEYVGDYLVEEEGYERDFPYIGTDLPVIRFCPWCGARKTAVKESAL